MRTSPANRAQPPPDEVSPTPVPGSPEAVFLAWLLWLPPDREPARAARDELARIDRYPAPLPAPVRHLRAMFAALLTADGEPAVPSATDPVSPADRRCSR